MPGEIARLAERKLLIVTGKGGTGKSVLSLALSYRIAAAGRRVWLVETGRKRDSEFSRLPTLLGRERLGHEPTEVTLPGTRRKIQASVLDPARSLAEYVDHKLPTGGLAGVLLNNRVTASFLEVVPGLPDLVQLGKLWHAATVAADGPDIVILDAPSTGHALALLRAPANFRRITRMGPVHRDASLMEAFLADSASTALVLAALPEEMAVQETRELRGLLGSGLPEPVVYVNKCFPPLDPIEPKGDGDAVYWKAYAYARARAEREAEASAAFPEATRLPFLFPEKGAPLFLRLAEHLA